MQTQLADFIRNTPQGEAADAILRKCVHCGFCTATCPTYQLLGNELDGPRGRIYLIKQMLEGEEPTARTQLHLDRCLTCRSCETTCPSGVHYAQLLEIGREVAEDKVPRKALERIVRRLFVLLLPQYLLTKPGFVIGQMIRPLIPAILRKSIPSKQRTGAWPKNKHKRKMVIHRGCVQRAARPSINAAAARFLDHQSITAVQAKDGCCGALGLHLGDRKFLEKNARRNIDVWWDEIQNGAEAIVSTASGCGVTIKEYGELMKHDQQYAKKAEQIASKVIDLSEVEIDAQQKDNVDLPDRVAIHTPCSLQHGQQVTGSIQTIMEKFGIETSFVADSHLCCGSAGVYSMLQPKIAGQLLDNRVAALEQGSPDCIVTANIGCLMHLDSGASVPVKHWVEVVAPPKTSAG